MDRRHALAANQELPQRQEGAALFADISGFTSLTRALARELGRRKGAELLLSHINRIYESLISELHRYGGSVVNFSGDAITCWFADNDASAVPRAAGAKKKAPLIL